MGKEAESLTGGDKGGWGHFYAGCGGTDYYARHIEIHREFLDRILRERPKKILEAGCGSGIMSVFFSKRGIECAALDRDRTVLEQARKNAAELGGRVAFIEGDIFGMDFRDQEFDLVFSQGVLEHFSDGDIQKAAREGLRVSRQLWVSVPNRYYRHRDFGDERLLRDWEWKKILSPVGHVRAEPYYYQRVKRNFLRKLPLMLMLGLRP